MQQDVPQAGPTPSQPHERLQDAPAQPQQTSFYQPAKAATYVAPPEPYQPQIMPQPPITEVSDGISWEASEYVHNAKGALWVVGFLATTAALLVFAIWLQVWTFVVLVVVMAIAMGYFAFRKPHIMQYRLTDDGIQINGKIYSYNDFRAFGILQDGAFFTMTLIPVKRLSPALSVYFAQGDGEQIVDIVGRHLPMENIKPDPLDTLMRRLRF